MNDIEMEAVNLLQSSPMNASLMLAQKDKSSSLSIAPVSEFVAYVFGISLSLTFVETNHIKSRQTKSI